MSAKETAKDDLLRQCRMVGAPAPVLEYIFHDTRKWRIDIAWPELRIGVEVDGGVYVGGRHTTGAGFEKDCDKFAEAACYGWRIIRVTPNLIKSGQAIGWIERLLT